MITIRYDVLERVLFLGPASVAKDMGLFPTGARTILSCTLAATAGWLHGYFPARID